MIKSFYTLPVFLSSKNCNKNLLINDRSQVHTPRYKLSTLHISSSDGVGRGPGLKTDYKLRLWSERESESEVEAGSWGWRVLSSRMWRWLRMRDGGGRVEARPGLRVSVSPHTLLADHLVSDISTFTICIQCVGVRVGNGINWIWGKWDWMVLFLQAILFGEKRMRFCDNYSANYFHSNLPCHLHNLLITDF